METSIRRGWSDWSGGLRQADWHVFSFGYVNPVHGAAAIAAFETRSDAELFVAEDLSRGPMYRCNLPVTLPYIELRNTWRDDLYLTSTSFSWTFVLTHEEFLGPYFIERSGDGRESA
jgi:hypothetical protein